MVTEKMIEAAADAMSRQDITFANCDRSWQKRTIRAALDAALSTDAEPVATMGDEDRTPMPTGFDAAQWRKADEVHHATALVANDTECVKIIYAALSPLASEPWQPRCSQGGRSHSLEEIFQDMSVAYDNGDNRISNILVWRDALSAQVQDVAGWKLAPLDDEGRCIADSALPHEMIEAGIRVQEQVNDDNSNYVAGETTDWDCGMVAVAIYRAMLAAAPAAKLEEKP